MSILTKIGDGAQGLIDRITGHVSAVLEVVMDYEEILPGETLPFEIKITAREDIRVKNLTIKLRELETLTPESADPETSPKKVRSITRTSFEKTYQVIGAFIMREDEVRRINGTITFPGHIVRVPEGMRSSLLWEIEFHLSISARNDAWKKIKIPMIESVPVPPRIGAETVMVRPLVSPGDSKPVVVHVLSETSG